MHVIALADTGFPVGEKGFDHSKIGRVGHLHIEIIAVDDLNLMACPLHNAGIICEIGFSRGHRHLVRL